LTFSKTHTENLLQENNITFLFAPHVHAKLRPFMKIRQELGLPTIFNLIGPLTNPINLETQLMGDYLRDKLETIANALHKLGRTRAVWMNGVEYGDEVSVAGDAHLVLLNEGTISSFTVHLHDLGLPVYDNKGIEGGTAKENAAILHSVLNNEASPYLDTVLL